MFRKTELCFKKRNVCFEKRDVCLEERGACSPLLTVERNYLKCLVEEPSPQEFHPTPVDKIRDGTRGLCPRDAQLCIREVKIIT
jgi:hypothetical protein